MFGEMKYECKDTILVVHEDRFTVLCPRGAMVGRLRPPVEIRVDDLRKVVEVRVGYEWLEEREEL